MSLFWRVFLTNAVLLIVAAIVLGVLAVTIGAPVALTETAVLVVGVVTMLLANLLLLRPSFVPLERLARRMRDVDLLQPGQRLPVTGPAEVGALVRAFNEMLERLETERRESGRRALAAQEGERRRIAQELHDEIGQTMSAVLLQIKRISSQVPSERRPELGEAQEAVRSALDEVRRIAHELRPVALDDLGLRSALTALSTGFSRRTGLRVERSFKTDLPLLTPDAELALYRVAQESLANVARHADASSVQLSLEQGRGGVVLRITDDGHGFGPDTPDGAGGLRGMRERALMVGGNLAIGAGPGGGVEVRFEVPATQPTP
jgi:two-component system, NarL family, sensor histidine kinase UhpB